MLVGFIHGVMNTDNMTISGETIDYGPCAFMEAFDPATVYSSIDHGGRYAYGNQPAVAEWNLARLAEALIPLFHPDQDEAVSRAEASLDRFRQQYAAAYSAGMRAKLGLSPTLPEDLVSPLIDDLLELLYQSHVDHTSFFRSLSGASRSNPEPVRSLFLDLPAVDDWLERWRGLGPDAEAMDRTNPLYIPRNHLVEEALAAATSGDIEPLERLMDAVVNPYLERPGLERYAATAPDDFGAYRTFCGT
jgi:uncharacterized protein YdiU (UPF0061 family)